MDVLQRLTGMPSLGTSLGAQHHRGGLGAAAPSPLSFPPAGTLEVRKRAYLRAAVRVLGRNTAGVQGSQAAGVGLGRGIWRDALPPAPLADVSVRLLLKELNDIVDPPRKLPRFKVHLRRAPTQEVRVPTAGGGGRGGSLFVMAHHFCRVQA